MIKINKNRLIKLVNLNTNVNKKIIEGVFNSLIDNLTFCENDLHTNDNSNTYLIK